MKLVSYWLAVTVVLTSISALPGYAAAGDGPTNSPGMPPPPSPVAGAPQPSPGKRLGKIAAITGSALFILSSAVFAYGLAHGGDFKEEDSIVPTAYGAGGILVSSLIAVPGFILWTRDSRDRSAPVVQHPHISLGPGPRGSSGASLALSF